MTEDLLVRLGDRLDAVESAAKLDSAEGPEAMRRAIDDVFEEAREEIARQGVVGLDPDAFLVEVGRAYLAVGDERHAALCAFVRGQIVPSVDALDDDRSAIVEGLEELAVAAGDPSFPAVVSERFREVAVGFVAHLEDLAAEREGGEVALTVEDLVEFETEFRASGRGLAADGVAAIRTWMDYEGRFRGRN